MKEDLTKSTIHGVKWSGISLLSNQVFQFVITAILARLLFPKDFGLVGMAAIFSGLVGTVNDLGLSSAIIQRKELDNSHLSTSFWASLVMGIIIFGIAFVVAPFAANFFEKEIVAPIIIVSSIGFIIGPFGVVHRSLLSKELKFKKIAIIEISATIISGITAISMAFLGFGVWSLVFNGLAANMTKVILLWILCQWHPSIQFSKERFKELFSFGANVTGHRIANYIGANIDYFFIGKFLGDSALGLYTLGYSLATYPQRRLSSIVTKVAFPAFSKIQDDNERIRRNYLKSITYISLVVFPLLISMIILAPYFIKVIYGNKWIPMIIPLQILCVAGFNYAIGTTTGSIFFSKNRPDIAFKMTLGLRVGLLGTLVFIAINVNHSIIGVAVAVVSYTLITRFISQWLANRLIDLKMKNYLWSLFPAVMGCLVMAGVLIGYHYIQNISLKLSDLQFLVSSIIIGGLTYFAFLKLAKVKSFDELLRILSEMVIPFFQLIRKRLSRTHT